MRIRLNAPGRVRVELELEDPQDHISRRILRRRDWYERDLLDDLRARAHPGAAIDVGAHIGNHTLWMAAVCGLDVIALEPNPDSRRQLQRNIALNGFSGRVQVLAAAASARAGRARLESPVPGNSGITHAISDPAGDVKTITLDSINVENVSIIKIDVEGQELDILDGARELLKRCAPILYVECATDEARARVEEFLAPFGYSCFGRYALTPTYGFARPTHREVALSATIMAHPKRQPFVSELIGALDGPASITWDRQNNRWETGRRSLLGIEDGASHQLVLQDDAIICRDLLAGARAAILEHPHSPISLYLGRQRPHAPKFVKLVTEARATGARWVSYPELCWGVALIFPRELIEPIIEFGDAHPQTPNYDKRISRYLESRKIATWYTVPSLVDHRAGAENPSLIPGRTGANRVAHWFIGRDASPLDTAEEFDGAIEVHTG